MPGRARQTIERFGQESLRRLQASERAVLDGFQRGRLRASLAVGVLLVGFLLVAQWRGVEGVQTDLETQSDQDLAIIIQEVTLVNDSLRAEVRRLESQLAEVEQDEAGQQELLNQAVREIQALRIATGLEAAVGPGVTLRITDPESVLLAQDLVSVVNELRAAGAEAIAIDGIRIAAGSGLSGSDAGVMLDGRRLSRDPKVIAIGNPGNLEQAVRMPGGIHSRMTAFPGVSVEVTVVEELEVPAADLVEFVHAERVDS